MFKYLTAVPFDRSFDDVGFTYIVPIEFADKIKKGQIIKVPFGKEELFAVCLDLFNDLINSNIELKEIIGIYNENIFLKDYQFPLINEISKDYFSLIHNSLNLFFPKNLKEKIIKDKINLNESNLFNYEFNFTKELTLSQNNAYNEIVNSENNNILLYGLTGSGKTEIYIKLIKEALDKGEQSLLLIPEIILTSQLVYRLKKVFGNNIISINSSISEATKTKKRISIYNNNAKIIIGTRSALFYPFDNLGLIIIDEEHDGSYISDISPRYNAIDIAQRIGEKLKIKVILGTGTPTIDSMYKSTKGKYKQVNLLEKFKLGN